MSALRRWFLWSPPRTVVTPAPVDPQEARVMSAHNHTPESWAALPNIDRIKARDTYTKARGYAA